MAINSTTLIFSLFFFFMSLLTWDSELRLEQYYKAHKIIKIPTFETKKRSLNQEDLEILELWESFLTGRSGPVSKWIKEDYKNLGLNHVFSPSGFHLSAVIIPLTFLIPFRNFQLVLFSLLAIGFQFLPGQWALKRILTMKIGQHFFGMKTGLVIAMLVDIFTGPLDQSPLSFFFSYLFLSFLILKKKPINIYFFFAQMLIFYFISDPISPLLILISPILNFLLNLAFPLLCILAIPMGDWSFETGMMLMKTLQFCVQLASKLTSSFPLLEINFGLIIACLFAYRAHKKMIYVCLLFMSQTLNSSANEIIKISSYDYIPQGRIIRKSDSGKMIKIYFKDGFCKQVLSHGVWWEKCSPKKRSTRKKRIKKLSFP